jgi:hypothetical protein
MADLSMSGGKLSVQDVGIGKLLDALRSRLVELPPWRRHIQEHLDLIDIDPEAGYPLLP